MSSRAIVLQTPWSITPESKPSKQVTKLFRRRIYLLYSDVLEQENIPVGLFIDIEDP